MTEAQFLVQVIQVAHLYGFLVSHSHDSRRDNIKAGIDPGYPDLTLTKPPRHIVIELKKEKGHLSGEQIVWLEALMASNAEVYVFWWSEEVIKNEIIPILKGE